MKKLLLSVAFVISATVSQGQVLLEENFDNLGDPMTLPAWWSQTNQSSPIGVLGWFRGGGGDPPPFGGYNGGQNGFIAANFNSTAGTGVISNWLISPVVTLENGDVISFYTRTATASTWADNLELRISTEGDASTNPVGATGLGSYTNLALTVNPVFPSAAGYPQVWTEMTYTVSGLAGPTESRIAWRYTVPTSAGPTGNNSNYIGIDAVTVTRTLSTDSFFKNNFTMYPNPASSVLNLSAHDGISITKATITDINGRVVASQNLDNVSESSLNVGNLTAGIYFVSVESAEGKGTAKFIKI